MPLQWKPHLVNDGKNYILGDSKPPTRRRDVISFSRLAGGGAGVSAGTRARGEVDGRGSRDDDTWAFKRRCRAPVVRSHNFGPTRENDVGAIHLKNFKANVVGSLVSR